MIYLICLKAPLPPPDTDPQGIIKRFFPQKSVNSIVIYKVINFSRMTFVNCLL